LLTKEETKKALDAVNRAFTFKRTDIAVIIKKILKKLFLIMFSKA